VHYVNRIMSQFRIADGDAVGYLFIKHLNVRWHTLVGRLSGIRTQSARVTASNSATVYRHFGQAAVHVPCPVFA
jgi:hypothetical protein